MVAAGGLALRGGAVVAALAVRCLGLSVGGRFPGAALSHAAAGVLADFDHLRRSVIRISAVYADFNWLEPFYAGSDGVGLGSGFVVQAEPYPLFVTNAHVISDAKKVTLQLLLFGAHEWDAEVVSVCTKFDLALLVLKDAAQFNEALKSRNIALEPLKLAEGVAAMGMDVVALGFPLGQDALKISKGNVAGNEDVNGNICIQSTAPISPGSSGGPLLDALGREVIGVNFAKATEGENINYVIPVWRVRQMVTKHLKDQPEFPADGNWKRIQLKVPSAELTTIVPNEALYSHSGGCSEGIYISKIGARSPFRRSEPPVLEGSFLLAVNGRPLDPFGTGMHESFVADRVAFSDLLFMVQDFSAGIEVETCFHGSNAKHKVSMLWAPENEQGLQYVDEPYIEGMSSKYEMFGDIGVMQMTVNHIHAVLNYYGDPGPARWLYPTFVTEPRLVINWLQPGSYASNIFSPGAAVSKVNGMEVRTLDDFRKHFLPQNSAVWTLETDLGEVVVLDFNGTLKHQFDTAMALQAPHMLTAAVVNAAESLGIRQPQEEPAAPGTHGCDGAAPTVQKAKAQQPQLAGAKHAALTRIAQAKPPPQPRASGPVLVARRAAGGGRKGFVAETLPSARVGRDGNLAAPPARTAWLSTPVA